MTHSPRARRRCLRARFALATLALASLVYCPLATLRSASAHEVTPERVTPVVLAVRQARIAVVSIRGQKTVLEPAASGDATAAETPRQVNGMGTGTVIDERGYILTNYHVVSDVRRIEVTMDDGRSFVGDTVAFDATADLAIVKIPTSKPLPTIHIGTSSDLMVGESVIALGNAFGYEQTVTRGIISALGRDVQVSDTQSYDDLIQTDASINPGNSGGPLLNIDGEMIGVNVAVRAGAQGIGFAIPIDNALQVASKLLNVERLRGRSHGLVTQAETAADGPLRVAKVENASPAEKIGIQPGDEIVRVGSQPVTRPIDLERAFLDRATGEPVAIEVRRNGQTLNLDLALAESTARPVATPAALTGNDARVWDVFGLNLSEEPHNTFDRRNTRYRGGMHVNSVRPNSPAAQEGILAGDILVGMQKWETASDQDIQYIITRPNLDQMGKLKFYVLRGQNTLYGHLNLASKPTTAADPTVGRH
ncbi:MAG TPA: trypsin-like peptidase domain-containing protein [Lacipirellulaceae bacterium]|jgi:serine protease Do|nr:trypsin-like peptidase domain-containing protein [Lacipirellulaceae bacterium]